MTRTVVFSGPTLSAAEVSALVDAEVLAPARQGDIWRAVRHHGPARIALIDGVFLSVPAVWHREILWAMARGVEVWGAASMGALRAAELHPFGMRGVGRIFEAYRDGCWPGFPEPFEDDDEVAVIHAPAELGGAALSDAMVDLRATLLAAEAEGVIDRPTRLSLAVAMKRTHFPDRTFRALAALAPAAFAAWLAGGLVSQKRLDAVALLRILAAADPMVLPDRSMIRFERALVWERFEADALRAEDQARRRALDEAPEIARSMRPKDVDSWLR